MACAVYRWRFWAYYDHNITNNQSQVRADALLVGCLLALLLEDVRFRAAAHRLARLWPLAAAVLLYCMSRFEWLPPLTECVAIACLIGTTVLEPRAALARVFSFAPLAYLGLISYSIYLWQELFMGFRSVLMLVTAMPLVVIFSYYGIEQPCTRLGHRLTRARGRSAPPDADDEPPGILGAPVQAAGPGND
jgi:peptidoglycan/LPS O-acetylase OafA/YrhL